MQYKFFNIVPGESEVAILLYGDVGEGQKVESGRVVSELLALSNQYKGKKIDVRINSNGGDVFSGMAIYNALRTSAADITIYVDGVAASIAGIIALCGKPLYLSPYAKLMLHSVSGGAWGNASDLKQMAATMETLESDLAGMIANRCGMNAEAVKAKYFDGVDHWIDAKDAVAMGLADGIYDMPGEDTPGSDAPKAVYEYFNNRLSNQPINYNKDMALIDQLKRLASLKDSADENAIVAKVKELENKATSAEALQKANETYRQRIKDIEASEIKAILDKAVEEKKLTKEQVPAFQALMETDREHAEVLLNSMKPSKELRASQYVNEGSVGAYDYAGKSWDEIDKAGKLAELKDKDKTLFAAKFKEKFGADYKE